VDGSERSSIAMKFSIHTLGCKVNQYDGALLQDALERHGFRAVGPGEEADAVVVNTCTVTAGTDRQNRQLIRRLRKAHPRALLVVTGCQAEAFPEVLKGMAEVDMVLGNQDKDDIPQIIVNALDGRQNGAIRPPSAGPLWGKGVCGIPGHTRAFLKVQDGCDARCAYCIVPRARGPSRSRPMSSIAAELRRMEEAGVKEVVITGIHLGSYGKDLEPPSSLAMLLRQILEACSIPRIRLSSVESMELEEGLLHCMRDEARVCPHLHVPLQSGDDEVLRWMGRPYGGAQYMERAVLAKELIPDLTWGCDVMVGFPGETRAHFQRTFRLLQAVPFTYLHVFPFSPRPGTRAWAMPHRVPASELKARASALRDMSRARRAEVMASYIGRASTVLVERPFKGSSGWMEGLTPNYLKALLPGGTEMHNRIVTVRLVGVRGAHLLAEPL